MIELAFINELAWSASGLIDGLINNCPITLAPMPAWLALAT